MAAIAEKNELFFLYTKVNVSAPVDDDIDWGEKALVCEHNKSLHAWV